MAAGAPNKHPRIRRAAPGDAETIRKIAGAAGIDAWTTGGYLDEILSANSIVLKTLDADDSIVGILVARVVPGGSDKEKEAELYNIAVLPSRERAGFGQAMMDYFLDNLSRLGVGKVWLEVRASNHKAIKFYLKNRFEQEIVRPNFYSNPVEDAAVMRRELSGAAEVSEGETKLDSDLQQE